MRVCPKTRSYYSQAYLPVPVCEAVAGDFLGLAVTALKKPDHIQSAVQSAALNAQV